MEKVFLEKLARFFLKLEIDGGDKLIFFIKEPINN